MEPRELEKQNVTFKKRYAKQCQLYGISLLSKISLGEKEYDPNMSPLNSIDIDQIFEHKCGASHSSHSHNKNL